MVEYLFSAYDTLLYIFSNAFFKILIRKGTKLEKSMITLPCFKKRQTRRLNFDSLLLSGYEQKEGLEVD